MPTKRKLKPKILEAAIAMEQNNQSPRNLQVSKAEDIVVSVDKDAIITVYGKADVWPYDDESTAVQVDTPYGYILVRVQRIDK